MNYIKNKLSLKMTACSLLAVAGTSVYAQGVPAPADDASVRIERLQQQLNQQNQQIEALRRELRTTSQQPGSATAQGDVAPVMAGGAAAAAGTVSASGASGLSGSSSADRAMDTTRRPVQVGTAPSQAIVNPPVAPLFEEPGILTPRGKYVLEPSLQYVYASSNRVALIGYTIIPSLLLGLVDVREVKSSTVLGAVALRYGLTDRLEVEAKLPYVYRSDSTISREIFTGASTDSVFSSSGKSKGDIELAARYQLNNGGGGFPFMVGALRFKSRTGKDPFEVVTDCVTRCVGNTTGTGLPLELPTGSGFYSLQPSLTWLFPSDPAVFFGSFSYTHNFSRNNLSRTVLNGEQEFIGSVSPGDIVGMNFGMGLALNEKSTFSVGFDLNSLGRTKQNGAPVDGSIRTQLATILLGYSYRYNDKTAFSVSVGGGLTRDTPDLTLTLRIPMSF